MLRQNAILIRNLSILLRVVPVGIGIILKVFQSPNQRLSRKTANIIL